MRATTAGLILAALASSFPLACANRGMQAPLRDGGPAGTGGRGGSGGTAGAGGGTGGTGGVACPGPTPTDASVDGPACTAKFNFETGIQGATIPATGQAAFTSAVTSSIDTYCGAGALAIAASFSGTSGNTTKGEVDIPIAAADMDFTGKTITVHFSAVPGCSTDLGFAVTLRTDGGDRIVLPTFRTVTASWKTETVTLTGDAGVANEMNVQAIVLQAFSTTGYQGTIYVDEIDVQ